MINSWFHKTTLDEAYYKENLAERLPHHIIDAHVHMNLEEHVKGVSKERISMDWALECGLQMEYEAALYYYQMMFPKQKIEMVAFPFPLAEVDITANNHYLSELGKEKKICPLMSVRPEWSAEYCEKMFMEGGFFGIKPYPYLASNVKGADISIYDFLPNEQLEIINKYKQPVVLHLPRRGRLPDKENIKELREIRQKYPDITLVLAHFGRCFTKEVFQKGMDALGQDKDGFYFDTAAVINPQVYALAMEELDSSKILFGTDFPIMTWHGIREWHTDTPTNIAREDFSWNRHEKGFEVEKQFTFIAYEQLNNILNAIGNNTKVLQQIFYDNAKEVFKAWC